MSKTERVPVRDWFERLFRINSKVLLAWPPYVRVRASFDTFAESHVTRQPYPVDTLADLAKYKTAAEAWKANFRDKQSPADPPAMAMLEQLFSSSPRAIHDLADLDRVLMSRDNPTLDVFLRHVLAWTKTASDPVDTPDNVMAYAARVARAALFAANGMRGMLHIKRARMRLFQDVAPRIAEFIREGNFLNPLPAAWKKAWLDEAAYTRAIEEAVKEMTSNVDDIWVKVIAKTGPRAPAGLEAEAAIDVDYLTTTRGERNENLRNIEPFFAQYEAIRTAQHALQTAIGKAGQFTDEMNAAWHKHGNSLLGWWTTAEPRERADWESHAFKAAPLLVDINTLYTKAFDLYERLVWRTHALPPDGDPEDTLFWRHAQGAIEDVLPLPYYYFLLLLQRHGNDDDDDDDDDDDEDDTGPASLKDLDATYAALKALASAAQLPVEDAIADMLDHAARMVIPLLPFVFTDPEEVKKRNLEIQHTVDEAWLAARAASIAARAAATQPRPPRPLPVPARVPPPRLFETLDEIRTRHDEERHRRRAAHEHAIQTLIRAEQQHLASNGREIALDEALRAIGMTQDRFLREHALTVPLLATLERLFPLFDFAGVWRDATREHCLAIDSAQRLMWRQLTEGLEQMAVVAHVLDAAAAQMVTLVDNGPRDTALAVVASDEEEAVPMDVASVDLLLRTQRRVVNPRDVATAAAVPDDKEWRLALDTPNVPKPVLLRMESRRYHRARNSHRWAAFQEPTALEQEAGAILLHIHDTGHVTVRLYRPRLVLRSLADAHMTWLADQALAEAATRDDDGGVTLLKVLAQ